VNSLKRDKSSNNVTNRSNDQGSRTIDEHGLSSVGRSSEKHHYGTMFDKPYSLDERDLLALEKAKPREGHLALPCTSVDDLLRQRLSGRTISSSDPTGGHQSVWTRSDNAHRPEVEALAKEAKGLDDDKYSLELLK